MVCIKEPHSFLFIHKKAADLSYSKNVMEGAYEYLT